MFKYLRECHQKLFRILKADNYSQLQAIRQKDILTLEEASLYLDIHPGILLEEVGLGKLPGGQLAGQWRFCKNALLNHFSIYHGGSPWIDESATEQEIQGE